MKAKPSNPYRQYYFQIRTQKETHSVFLNATGSIGHYFHFLFDFLLPFINWKRCNGILFDEVRSISVNDHTAMEMNHLLRELIGLEFKLELHLPNKVNVNKVVWKSLNPLKCSDSFPIDQYRQLVGKALLEIYTQINLNKKTEEVPFHIYLIERETALDRGAARRIITNHNLLKSWLENFAHERGFAFRNLRLSDMTLKEQIKTFQISNMTIGQHGAGLANIIFGSEQQKLIELTATPEKTHFKRLAELMKVDYFPIYVKEKKGEHIVVDIEHFGRVLEKLL